MAKRHNHSEQWIRAVLEREGKTFPIDDERVWETWIVQAIASDFTPEPEPKLFQTSPVGEIPCPICGSRTIGRGRQWSCFKGAYRHYLWATTNERLKKPLTEEQWEKSLSDYREKVSQFGRVYDVPIV